MASQTYDFTQADSTTLPAGLTESLNDAQTISNKLRTVTNGGSTPVLVTISSPLSGADQSAQAAVDYIGAPTSGTIRVGVNVRSNSAGDTHYWAQLNKDSTSVYQLLVGKRVSGTDTTLQTTPVTPTLPATVRLEVSGTSITAYIAGVQVGTTVTDSSITTGNYAGARLFGQSGTRTVSLDDLVVADLVTSSPAAGTASLSLSASGATAAPVAGSATLALAATGAGQAVTTGSAALALAASSSASGVATGSSVVTITATGTAASPGGASGSASLALGASGTARGAGTATGALGLAASGAGRGVASSSGALNLNGNGTPGGSGTASASLALVGSATLAARAAAQASLALSALGTATGSSPTVRGSVTGTLDPPMVTAELGAYVTATLDPPALSAEWSRP